MDITRVEDNEELYRAVRANDPDAEYQEYRVHNDGRVQVTAWAFKDPGRQPSVDRAKLLGGKPVRRFSVTDGILSLITERVRSLRLQQYEKGKPSDKAYTVDVKHRPEPKNEAHAQIECDPRLSRGRFDVLREELANIVNTQMAAAHVAGRAQWTLEPAVRN